MLTAHSWAAEYVKAQQPTAIDIRDVTVVTWTNNTGLVAMTMTHRPTGIRVETEAFKSQHKAREHLIAELTTELQKPKTHSPTYEPACVITWATQVAAMDSTITPGYTK